VLSAPQQYVDYGIGYQLDSNDIRIPKDPVSFASFRFYAARDGRVNLLIGGENTVTEIWENNLTRIKQAIDATESVSYSEREKEKSRPDPVIIHTN
jgi:hypothetical protein